jgi:hypothetical protein
MTSEKHPLQRACGHCEHCGGDAAKRVGDVLRCECGSLLARYVAGRIELKCRRCKRTVAVAVEAP